MESEKQLVRITQTKTEIVYLFHIRFHPFSCSNNMLNKRCVQNEASALKKNNTFFVLFRCRWCGVNCPDKLLQNQLQQMFPIPMERERDLQHPRHVYAY